MQETPRYSIVLCRDEYSRLEEGDCCGSSTPRCFICRNDAGDGVVPAFWTADFLEKSEMMLRIFSNKTETMLCGIASAMNTEGKRNR